MKSYKAFALVNRKTTTTTYVGIESKAELITMKSGKNEIQHHDEKANSQKQSKWEDKILKKSKYVYRTDGTSFKNQNQH